MHETHWGGHQDVFLAAGGGREGVGVGVGFIEDKHLPLASLDEMCDNEFVRSDWLLQIGSSHAATCPEPER